MTTQHFTDLDPRDVYRQSQLLLHESVRGQLRDLVLPDLAAHPNDLDYALALVDWTARFLRLARAIDRAAERELLRPECETETFSDADVADLGRIFDRGLLADLVLTEAVE